MNQAQPALIGEDAPLGATLRGGAGVNFALFSAHAERVELCLFDERGERETSRLPLTRGNAEVWSTFVPGLRAGARYGYRVYGPYDPARGHRFDPSKLLLDPYARQFDRPFELNGEHFSTSNSSDRTTPDPLDSASSMPKCVVVAPRAPRARLASRKPNPVIYEAHVRGLTKTHPGISESQRGTFAALASRPVLEYLQKLGIDALELMPVHYAAHERALHQRGLRNYWGYSSVGFFAPAAHYLASESVEEVCAAVDALHDAGIEVILDVAFNHSGEGDAQGPTLCFRGIDNASYYRLDGQQPEHYVNDTGCGNTLNLSHPRVLQLVMDSLRYWAEEIGVDGFRFDLATTLARDAQGFDPRASFFDVLQQDPVLSRVRLIAEPWDVGPGGYQLGRFPRGWQEWNDKYRDSIRRFWRGDAGQLGEFARRLHGSSDLFEASQRGPVASVNFVTCHDGFTLNDLVSYNDRHNEANGEDNRDGHRENYSQNFGVEGNTSDPQIQHMRRQQRRNFLATLLFSQGTPMLLSGDELGRSQQGNNNAYCQDNALSWHAWESLQEDQRQFFAFTSRLIDLRRKHPLLRVTSYLQGESGDDHQPRCCWLSRHGGPMHDGDWQDHARTHIALLLEPAPQSQESRALMLLFNAGGDAVRFALPAYARTVWRMLLDTTAEDGGKPRDLGNETDFLLAARSVCLLERIAQD